MTASVPLSKSILWDLQKKAYTEFGIESWTQKGVPFHITNNSLIAKQYAKTVFPLFKKGRVTFLEVGAGSGKFAFLFLSELFQLGIDKSSVCYLLTDFAEKNVSFWEKHPSLTLWIQEGVIRPSIYDPLILSEQPPSFDVMIANYFFDTIPQDLFRVEKGELFEGLVSISGDEISHLSLEYSYVPIKKEPYFDHPKLDHILRCLQQTIDTGSFLFPSSGLKMLDHLFSASSSPFKLLVADRGGDGIVDEKNLFCEHGTFSFPVHFQALAQFFIQRGGEAYFPKEIASRFTVGLFSSDKMDRDISEFFCGQSFAPFEINHSSLSSILGELVKSNWDASLFFFYFERLEKLLENATDEERGVFLEGAHQIESHFYPLGGEEMLFLDQLRLYLDKEVLQRKLDQMIYTDADLEELLSQLNEENCLDVKYVAQFLKTLEEKKQITQEQLERILCRL